MALQAGGQRIRGQGLHRCIYHLNLYTGMSSEFCAFTLQPADRKKVRLMKALCNCASSPQALRIVLASSSWVCA